MKKTKRQVFKSKWGFILASVGGAVGLGNIWRFPILVSEYGGLAFLIPYFIFVILITIAGVVGETSLGRLTGGGPNKALGTTFKNIGKEKLGRNISLFSIIGVTFLAISYLVIIAWVIKYCFLSLTGSLYSLGTDINTLSSLFANSTNGLSSTLWIVIAGLVVLVILAFNISKGLEKINKILMPLLFAIFIGLAIYIATLNNAGIGYRYLFTLQDPSVLLNPKVWIYAFGQAFFSLSVFGTPLLVYGSYMPKSADIKFSAKIIALFDTIASLLAAIVIIPAMASVNAPVDIGGPNLIFVYLLAVLNSFKGGIIVETFLFIAILFAGISSLISMLEVPIEYINKRFKLKRSLSALIICLFAISISILIQSATIKCLDFISIYIIPTSALIAAFSFYFIAKKEDALKEINTGAKHKSTNKLIYLGRYVYCPLTLLALILGIIFGGIG